jgi:hypothetical protein
MGLKILSLRWLKKHMKEASNYEPGGREITPTHLLLLLGEMEGAYQNLKYMGFFEDMEIINVMKQKYYKLYFSTKKNK